MDKKTSFTTAQLLISINAISLQPKKPFKFTSGILSPIYIDNRLTMSYPKVRQKIIAYYIDIIVNKIGLKNINILSGTAMAAIPQTAFIAQKVNLPMVFVRDTKKGHGKQNQIEGVVDKKQKAVIIEDHISTGGSTIGNLKALKKAGALVKYAIATTTYSFDIAKKIFIKNKLKIFTLTNIKDIVDVAIKDKIIKPEDKQTILVWAKSPKTWGKKFGFK